MKKNRIILMFTIETTTLVVNKYLKWMSEVFRTKKKI